ncbi:unnamed protein product [Heligmosomoides polygyrus]|uniref:Bestrophin homolog n=1 Tax=Heligmosomoides polygyrus TaxID=6339 RepID=A0A183FJD4_HELPZ|nr:unnamed protein product [Heligmosomoides polygyrus]
MTVNYMRDAATVRLGTFLKLLFRWRGSVWKLIWKELILFLFIYFNLCVLHRFFLKGSDVGPTFERLVMHCRTLMRDASTVLTFALGFYVSQIADRPAGLEAGSTDCPQTYISSCHGAAGGSPSGAVSVIIVVVAVAVVDCLALSRGSSPLNNPINSPLKTRPHTRLEPRKILLRRLCASTGSQKGSDSPS